MIKQLEVINANIHVHTLMVDSYHKEPHFRPENQQKVKNVLRDLFAQSPAGGKNGKLLDMGCGTGFIINLVKDFVSEVHGIDVTQAMMDKIDTSSGNIILHNGQAEKTPYDDQSFDMVTAYAFLHHLYDYVPVLKEAYRVLKPNGIMYIDLEPNHKFWQAMRGLEKMDNTYSDIIKKEIGAVLHIDEQVAGEFNISPDLFRAAEFIKAHKDGIDADAFLADAKEIGYSSCSAIYQWFLGQGNISHQQSFATAADIDAYLLRIMPLSQHLYKYIRFVLVK